MSERTSTDTSFTQANATDLDDFVGLSAALTGIAADQLHPFLDRYNTAQTYLDLTRTRCGNTFGSLMGVYGANKTKPPAEIATIVLQQSGTDVAYLARSVMLLWYLASWYDPQKLQMNPPPPGGVPFTIVSSDAYTQGWVWRVGQTHPMGYSEWTFGYWHTDPPPLSAFIGGGTTT